MNIENIEQAERQQFDAFIRAMEAKKFNFSVTKPNGEKLDLASPPRAIHNVFKTLQQEREQGSTVRVKSESEEVRYLTVSGLTESALRALREDGYSPAIVTETASGEFQAVIKAGGSAPKPEFDRAAEALQIRYGNGQSEGVVIPGFYSVDTDRLPRVSRIDEAAPRQGLGGIREKIERDAPRYAEHEEKMRVFLAAQGQGQDEGPAQAPDNQLDKIFGAWQQAQAQKEEERQKRQQEQDQKYQKPGGLDDLIEKLLSLVLRAVTYPFRKIYEAVAPAPVIPAQAQAEGPQAPDFWQRQAPCPENELRPVLQQAQTQTRQQEQAQTQRQTQEQTQRQRPRR